MPYPSAPKPFKELADAIESFEADLNRVNSSGYEFKLTRNGAHVDLSVLSQAASKFQLAERVAGLNLNGYSERSETADAYSGQIIMVVSVVCFESYCRLFGENKKWHEIYRQIVDKDAAKVARDAILSLELDENFLKRLKGSQHKKDGKNLVRKISEFEEGDILNSYALAVAFRNAFSHGKLGSLSKTLDVAEKLRVMILTSVEADLCSRTTSILKV